MYICIVNKTTNIMKRFFTTLILTMFAFTYLNAQNVLNNAADNIVGTYSGVQDV